MLTIVGDIIEFDGKPFAIITAPLSGWRMDALDCVNDYPAFLEQIVTDIVFEEQSDFKNAVLALINDARDEVWLDPSVADWLCAEIRKIF